MLFYNLPARLVCLIIIKHSFHTLNENKPSAEQKHSEHILSTLTFSEFSPKKL